MTQPSSIILETATCHLQLEQDTGRLLSLRSWAAPDQEFILTHPQDPSFVLQYLDEDRRFRQIVSSQARHIETHVEHSSGGEITVHTRYHQLNALDIDVTTSVRTNRDTPFSHWSLSLDNRAGLLVTDIQFPFVVAPYKLAGANGAEALLWPLGAGKLIQAPRPQQLTPDSPHAWQMRPENYAMLHYPGFTVAQFLAYYNDRAGLYIACQDNAGFIKLLKPVHHGEGLRLGFAHMGDWPSLGQRTLDYDIVLGCFTGDWYTAAELYRQWSQQQPWTQTPLTQRRDVPEWLLDSPPHVILRMQGELDMGPAQPNEAFLPYSKTLPLLDAISERVEAPLVPVIMAWERPGPWVYPDCFPPVGGGEALVEFTAAARGRGWHVGTFCNGTRWVAGHFWSGYDGEAYFMENQGEQSVCRTHDAALWKEQWDATWRPSYTSCVGAPQTQTIAADFVQTLLDLGLDWIQFLDQNIGCASFPCFAGDHEHPSTPGVWMTAQMTALLDGFHAQAAARLRESQGERQVIFSVEGPVTEYFIPRFAICDIRLVPPGHHPTHWLWWDAVPLYHFLYHEYILMQGGFGHGADPHHLAIRNAYNFVLGEIPGAVLKGDGQLLNVDSPDLNWAPWSPQVGDNEEALAMLNTTSALRRGPGKSFLVYGRMLRPAQIEQIKTIQWDDQTHHQRVPAVFHCAWQSPDGQYAVALANWTQEAQSIIICDQRLGQEATLHLSTLQSTSQITSEALHPQDERFTLTLPPLSCGLLVRASITALAAS